MNKEELSEIKEKLGINNWLELIKEDKNLNGAYISISQCIWLLEQENKRLKENAEHNDKVVDKVNWENQLLKKENKQLKDNWNKLKEYLNYKSERAVGEDEYIYDEIYNEMQEMEQGSDE